jgi:hypothetical protein
VTLAQQAVQVRYRNRESLTSGTAATDLPGWYYFTLEMARTDSPDARVEAPVTLAVDVSGAVTGTPAYDAAAEAPSPTAPGAGSKPAATPGRAGAKNSGSGSFGPVVLGLIAALVIAGAVTAVVVRGRGRP